VRPQRGPFSPPAAAVEAANSVARRVVLMSIAVEGDSPRGRGSAQIAAVGLRSETAVHHASALQRLARLLHRTASDDDLRRAAIAARRITTPITPDDSVARVR
jgi:hypothetical protein